jgi:hypothetical protein
VGGEAGQVRGGLVTVCVCVSVCVSECSVSQSGESVRGSAGRDSLASSSRRMLSGEYITEIVSSRCTEGRLRCTCS